MKKIISVIMCLLLLLSFGTIAFAADEGGTTYYVDSVSGNDNNTGKSPQEAFKTINKANRETLNAGDKILLKCGSVFDNTLVLQGSGEKDNPVVISSYGEGEKPVIHTGSDSFIMIIQNFSNLIIENLELTSDGYGCIIVAHSGENTENITMRNCYLHDISPTQTSTNNAAILINNERGVSRIRNIHLDSLKIENVAWGIHTNGINDETDSDIFVSTRESYNSDYLFENIYIKNAVCGGIVMGAVYNGLVRNCRVIACATANDSAYAPLWLRHCDNVTVEYCEISGSTNQTDGMAVDFDGWTVNSTYRYIYSHDNTRFMKNCVFDNKTNNSGNSVYNCISVNDNEKMNWGAICLMSSHRPSAGLMKNFTFKDNIMINAKPVFWICTKNPDVSGNSFTSTPFMTVIQKLFNVLVGVKAFDYGAVSEEKTNSLIAEITENLPKW